LHQIVDLRLKCSILGEDLKIILSGSYT